MKKLLYALLCVVGMTVLFSTSTQAACDQTFYGTLRQGKQSTFYDEFINNRSSNVYLRNYDVSYTEQYDYNRSSSFPSFAWTDAIKSANYTVKPGQTTQFVRATSAYPVYDVPATRSYNNFLITYTVTWSPDVAGNDKRSHTECMYYEVTRCGDGVVDSGYGETCDDGANNGKPGYCKTDCTWKVPAGCTAVSSACGSANGTTVWSKPTTNLCANGTTPTVTGTGPRGWTCTGKNTDCTDTSTSCSANKTASCTAISSACGSANGTTVWSKPTSNLCANGTTPTVTGTGPRGWTCTGKNTDCTDTSTSCSANKTASCTAVSSACGSADGTTVWSKPTSNLCANGTTPTVTGTGPRGWTCTGKNTDCTDTSTSCSANKTASCTAVSPACGSANWTTASSKPTTNLCANGATPTVTGSWPRYWTCTGKNTDCTDTSMSCSASTVTTCAEVSPACGSANWTTVWNKPTTNLCANGTTPTVTGDGPWGWTCTGKNTDCTDTSMSCSANKTVSCTAVSSACGSANGTTVSTKPTTNLCANGATPTVTGTGPRGWTCTGKNTDCTDTSTSCSANKTVTPPAECDQVFTGTLRYGKGYMFGDVFNASSVPSYLWSYKVEYQEQYDYNNSPDFPQFGRTNEIKAQDYTVYANQSLQVIAAKTSYDILAVPATRNFNNLFLKYTITYSQDIAGNNKVAHTECKYYEISRCGDGVLDADREEQCDEGANNGKPGSTCSIDCKTVTAQTNLWIRKRFADGTTGPKTYNIGDTVEYRIDFGNSGSTAATVVSLKDFVPQNLTGIQSTMYLTQSSTHSDYRDGGVYVDVYDTITLPAGASGYFMVRGTISSNYQNSRLNRACIYLNGQVVQCEEVIYNISPERPRCTAPELWRSGSLSADQWGRANITVTCRTNNGQQADTIEVLCGNGRSNSATHASSVSTTCEYTIGDYSQSFTPSCRVNGETMSECQRTLTVNPYIPGIGYCGDRQATDWEDCDCYNGSKNCSLSDANVARRANNRGGNRCVNCKIEWWEGVTPIACFNTQNGSISINKGERLPFYWNIERMGESSEHYEEVRGYSYRDSLRNYRDLQGESCDQEGDIALNAMICTFKVYNGKEIQSQGNVVYEIELPCFTEGSDIQADRSSSPLISSFLNRNTNNFIKDGNFNGGNTFWSYDIRNDKNYRFRSSVFVIKDFGRGGMSSTNEYKVHEAKTIDYYGEYKLSLDEVKYLQCSRDRRWEVQDPYPRVCEVNFSVTKPYVLQKTPSGTVNATNAELSKFRMYADGTQTFAGILNSVLTVNPSDYTATSQVQDAMTSFVNKYSKLAVKVNSNLFGATTVKKVPWKDIYFVEGDLNIEGFRYIYDVSKTRKNETHGSNAVYDRPFTIVQTSGNTTIKGNLNHNMMLLTKGTITFDASKNCNDAQVLKGIFYAENGFKSVNVQRNNNEKNAERCIGQNLHIKGIAIGDGLNQVMQDRRSELNEWFWSPGTLAADQARRRELIMNGASLLIEYSPSIFTASTMPAGAEEFTKALEVYRK